MNCENCGALISLADAEDHFICGYCGTRYYPKPNSDGIKVIGETSEIDCPICRKTLLNAWIYKTRVHYCEHCRGVLIKSSEFGRAIAFLRANLGLPPLPPSLINPEQLQRQIFCPSCGKSMHTHPYAGPGNIVIDNCPSCGVNWLDHNELEKIVRTPERRRKEENWQAWDVPFEGDVPDFGI